MHRIFAHIYSFSLDIPPGSVFGVVVFLIFFSFLRFKPLTPNTSHTTPHLLHIYYVFRISSFCSRQVCIVCRPVLIKLIFVRTEDAAALDSYICSMQWPCWEIAMTVLLEGCFFFVVLKEAEEEITGCVG